MPSDFINLPADIFTALAKNTEVMEKNNANTIIEKESKEKEKINKKNIINKPRVRPALTTDEKKRYSLIGNEFLKPLFKKIEAWKNKESMLIKDDMDIVQKKLNEQYINKKTKKGSSDSWQSFIEKWTMIAIAGGAILLWAYQKLSDFFSNLKLNEKIDGIIKWFKDKYEWIKKLFNFEKIANFFKKILNDVNLTDIWEKITQIYDSISNGFSAVWNAISSKINFGAIWDAIKGIPLAITSPLAFLGSKLLSFFDVKIGENSENNTVQNRTQENNTHLTPEFTGYVDPNTIRLENEMARRRMQSRLDDPTTFLRTGTYQELQKNFLPKIKNEFKSLGISLEKGVLSENETLDTYRAKVKEEISKQFEGGIGQGLSEEVNVKLDKYVKGLNFKNPPSIDEIRKNLNEIILNNKQNLTNFEKKQLDEATLGIASMAEKFNKLPEMYKQLELGEELSKNSEKAFEILQENAKKEGRLSEFHFIEARNVILDSSTKIVNAFNEFSDKIANAITEDLKTYFTKLKPEVVLKPKLKVGDDKSTNNYSIVTLDKSDIKVLNDKVVELTEKTVEEIKEQNKVLSELVSSIKAMPTSNNASNIIASNTNLKNSQQLLKSSKIATVAQGVRNNSINSVS